MKKIIFVLVGILIFISFNSCSKSLYVPLNSSSFQSTLKSQSFPKYKGKEILLGQFTNNAEDTSIFYFYNSKRSIYYGGPVLTSFLWHCFNSALLDVGFGVHEHNSPKDTPELDFTFRSLDENEIHFTVVLKKNTFQIFKKDYQVRMPIHQSMNPKYLEHRVYKFIDKIISRILKDTEFETAIIDI